ncbi:hypothetical protein [Halosimplex marinum]|uniref:hypothetical protein n=1 Tax=Halosimplex marinum TaxID=3396620 RepID=UPI003F546915
MPLDARRRTRRERPGSLTPDALLVAPSDERASPVDRVDARTDGTDARIDDPPASG